MNCSPPGSSVRRISQARILEWVAISFSQWGLPDPRIEPRSPELQTDSLSSEPPGKSLLPLLGLKPYKSNFSKSHILPSQLFHQVQLKMTWNQVIFKAKVLFIFVFVKLSIMYINWVKECLFQKKKRMFVSWDLGVIFDVTYRKNMIYLAITHLQNLAKYRVTNTFGIKIYTLLYII